uniref:ATP synthase complex subunit 8 n=1 Tax=Colaspidea globosa TaxID=1425613 RepID=A0A3G1GP21_9CUCU|nr:ATP synthase F0 subunit 8 [Colaspidea globosa]
MPQMAPLNWLTLYILFTIIFLLFLTQNYFHQIIKMKQMSKSKFSKLNWKW